MTNPARSMIAGLVIAAISLPARAPAADACPAASAGMCHQWSPDAAGAEGDDPDPARSMWCYLQYHACHGTADSLYSAARRARKAGLLDLARRYATQVSRLPQSMTAEPESLEGLVFVANTRLLRELPNAPAGALRLDCAANEPVTISQFWTFDCSAVPIRLSPGTYLVTIGDAAPQPVVVNEGLTTVHPPPPPPSHTWAKWTLVVGGALVLLYGAFSHDLAVQTQADIDDYGEDNVTGDPAVFGAVAAGCYLIGGSALTIGLLWMFDDEPDAMPVAARGGLAWTVMTW